MNRIPPSDVRRILRKEVGYGCPVIGCGNPYLYWHHFDPPWEEKEHHNPEGMIALCAEHHAKADAGTFTKEQLRKMKQDPIHQGELRGRFDWMRNKLLAVIGNIFYYETLIIFEFRGEPAIWFNRDTEGYLLLNIRMLTASGEQRIRIEDNFWLNRGNPEDLECPPMGKLLKVKYSNGDKLKIEFIELVSEASAAERYPAASISSWGIPFPVTAVEVTEKVGGTNIEFGPRGTKVFGNVVKTGFIRNCRVGISIT